MPLRGLGGIYSSSFSRRRRGEYRLLIELNGGGRRVDSLKSVSREREGTLKGVSDWDGGCLQYSNINSVIITTKHTKNIRMADIMMGVWSSIKDISAFNTTELE